MSTVSFITIDSQSVEVTPGEHILAAAQRVSLDIPTVWRMEETSFSECYSRLV